jgi:hypothetical protein
MPANNQGWALLGLAVHASHFEILSAARFSAAAICRCSAKKHKCCAAAVQVFAPKYS